MATAKKAQSEQEVQITAELDTAELANGFLQPFDRFSSSDIDRVILDFNKEGNAIKMAASNSERSVLIFVEYQQPIIDAFEIQEDLELGIIDVKQFKSMVGIFGDGFDMKVAGDVTIENENQEFIFRPSSPDAIPVTPKRLSSSLEWKSEFVWTPSEFGGFTDALGALSQEYVIFEGEAGEKTISIKLCNKDIKASSFEITIDLEDENEDSFKVILPKKQFAPVVKSIKYDLTVQISDRLISFFEKGEHSTIKHYIAVVS